MYATATEFGGLLHIRNIEKLYTGKATKLFNISIDILLLFLLTIIDCFAQEVPLFLRYNYYQDYRIRDFILDDINNDNVIDIAVLISELGISISLGKGNGSFEKSREIEFEITNLNYYIMSDDFNLDGNKDLFVLTRLFLGDGNGGFEEKNIEVMSGSSPISGDFNNDKIPDIAISISQPPVEKLNIFLCNGNGTFQKPIPLAIPDKVGIKPVYVEDFNKDGN